MDKVTLNNVNQIEKQIPSYIYHQEKSYNVSTKEIKIYYNNDIHNSALSFPHNNLKSYNDKPKSLEQSLNQSKSPFIKLYNNPPEDNFHEPKETVQIQNKSNLSQSKKLIKSKLTKKQPTITKTRPKSQQTFKSQIQKPLKNERKSLQINIYSVNKDNKEQSKLKRCQSSIQPNKAVTIMSERPLKTKNKTNKKKGNNTMLYKHKGINNVSVVPHKLNYIYKPGPNHKECKLNYVFIIN
jgi:hypothetical protein